MNQLHTSGKALLIEDNISNVRLMERVLQTRPGIHLVVAMQGRLGIELAKQHKPDVIFLDINLPDISGFEVLQELKRDPETRHLTVFVASADATGKQVERMMAAGAAGYLTKPLDVAKVLELLDNLLELKKVA